MPEGFVAETDEGLVASLADTDFALGERGDLLRRGDRQDNADHRGVLDLGAVGTFGVLAGGGPDELAGGDKADLGMELAHDVGKSGDEGLAGDRSGESGQVGLEEGVDGAFEGFVLQGAVLVLICFGLGVHGFFELLFQAFGSDELFFLLRRNTPRLG